jgi:hypothetical protein
MHECRQLLFAVGFSGAREVAARGAARARGEGDERAWRRLADQQALALNGTAVSGRLWHSATR